MKVDGSIDKVRLITFKDYRQKEGLDYFDTYSLITKINFIRMRLAIAVLWNLQDIKWMWKQPF